MFENRFNLIHNYGRKLFKSCFGCTKILVNRRKLFTNPRRGSPDLNLIQIQTYQIPMHTIRITLRGKTSSGKIFAEENTFCHQDIRRVIFLSGKIIFWKIFVTCPKIRSFFRDEKRKIPKIIKMKEISRVLTNLGIRGWGVNFTIITPLPLKRL